MLVLGMLAIDVVLLIPPALQDALITLNRSLQGEAVPSFALNTSDCLPHVSLAMGCMREEELPAVTTTIATLAATQPRVALVPTAFHVRQSQAGYMVTSVQLERTIAIQGLHESVMRAVEPYVSREATPEMFVDPASVTKSALGWVNDYASAASFERFWPHITLGMGSLPEASPLPRTGFASRLALCQLGAHCTCRRLRFESVLREG